MVYRDLSAKRGTLDCVLVVPEATHETETRELLGGTEENSISPMRSDGSLQKGNRKKLS